MATLLKDAPAAAVDGERPASADTPQARRARYFDSGNAFALQYPPVPCHQFVAERDRALAPTAATGLIPLDLSEPMGIEFPATARIVGVIKDARWPPRRSRKARSRSG